jgi:hypothetical protein
MRELLDSLEVFYELTEAAADLKRQAVVLMGLPAAGKSTFVRDELSRWVPGFHAPKVENTDVQLKRTQRERADVLFKRLKSAKSEAEYKAEVGRNRYRDNSGKWHEIATTYDEFQRMRGGSDLFKAEFKTFFATWFDMRDLAKHRTSAMFGDKISKAGDGMVFDTVAAKPEKIISKLRKTRDSGFANTIFYLEVDPKLSIIRDVYRGRTEGRTVGEGVIMTYAKQMQGAYDRYLKEIKDPDGVIDRLYHFRWKQLGDHPKDGTWKLVAQHRGDVKREVAKRQDAIRSRRSKRRTEPPNPVPGRRAS